MPRLGRAVPADPSALASRNGRGSSPYRRPPSSSAALPPTAVRSSPVRPPGRPPLPRAVSSPRHRTACPAPRSPRGGRGSARRCPAPCPGPWATPPGPARPTGRASTNAVAAAPRASHRAILRPRRVPWARSARASAPRHRGTATDAGLAAAATPPSAAAVTRAASSALTERDQRRSSTGRQSSHLRRRRGGAACAPSSCAVRKAWSALSSAAGLRAPGRLATSSSVSSSGVRGSTGSGFMSHPSACAVLRASHRGLRPG